MRNCGKGVIYLTRITVVKEDIAEKFRLFMENGRIMLFRENHTCQDTFKKLPRQGV